MNADPSELQNLTAKYDKLAAQFHRLFDAFTAAAAYHKHFRVEGSVGEHEALINFFGSLFKIRWAFDPDTNRQSLHLARKDFFADTWEQVDDRPAKFDGAGNVYLGEKEESLSIDEHAVTTMLYLVGARLWSENRK